MKGSGDLKELVIRQALLNLLTHQHQPPPVTRRPVAVRANVRFDPITRNYISLATNLPTQLINPTTSRAINAASTFVDPLSVNDLSFGQSPTPGQVIETATGHPLGFLDTVSGTFVSAIAQPQQQQPQQTAPRFAQQPALLGARAGKLTPEITHPLTCS
ncbi:hypothetical protein ElyMa_005357000 [Elysia marginata]|uniref:Uncharacterized protein n=1 Tax=Elysia marginata TaxID=1093978 RepID=A0AAV4EBF9_9GAST|nr:hypothetical protein ElyMa_005357000 [Elysia marginata]